MSFPIAHTHTFLGAGYHCGGDISGYSAQICKIRFNTKTTSANSSALVTARSKSTGVNSYTLGYVLGGLSSGGYSSEIDGVIYATDAQNNPAAALSIARNVHGFNSTTRGYCFGGENGVSRIDGITFNTESSFNLGDILTAQRSDTCGTFHSNAKGFACGGWVNGDADGYTTKIDGLVFSNESVFTSSGTLSAPLNSTCGINSASNGYAIGGYVVGVGIVNKVDKMPFATESVQTISSVIGTARSNFSGSMSCVSGFVIGGYIPNSPYLTQVIDELVFSNETTSVLSAVNSYGNIQMTCAHQFGAL